MGTPALLQLFFWRRAVKKAENEIFQIRAWERGLISDERVTRTTRYGRHLVAEQRAVDQMSGYPASRIVDHTTRGFRDRPYR